MEDKKSLDKLLVVDDQEENLECVRNSVNQIKKEGYLQNYTANYLNSFEQGLEEVRTKAYRDVITDLFEGRDNPKGLKIALECYDLGIRSKILTEGDRHKDELGGLRYYLDNRGDYPKARELGITPEEMEKRGLTFWRDLLIGENGIPDKKSVAQVTKALKEYFNIPYLRQPELEEKIQEKLPEKESLSFHHEIEGIGNYSIAEVGVWEREGAKGNRITDKLYLVKEKEREVYLKQIKEGECEFPECKVEGNYLTVEPAHGSAVTTKLE